MRFWQPRSAVLTPPSICCSKARQPESSPQPASLKHLTIHRVVKQRQRSCAVTFLQVTQQANQRNLICHTMTRCFSAFRINNTSVYHLPIRSRWEPYFRANKLKLHQVKHHHEPISTIVHVVQVASVGIGLETAWDNIPRCTAQHRLYAHPQATNIFRSKVQIWSQATNSTCAVKKALGIGIPLWALWSTSHWLHGCKMPLNN